MQFCYTLGTPSQMTCLVDILIGKTVHNLHRDQRLSAFSKNIAKQPPLPHQQFSSQQARPSNITFQLCILFRTTSQCSIFANNPIRQPAQTYSWRWRIYIENFANHCQCLGPGSKNWQGATLHNEYGVCAALGFLSQGWDPSDEKDLLRTGCEV